MTASTDRIALRPEHQARTEFMIMHRHGPDQAWFAPEMGTTLVTREGAERAVERERAHDQDNISKYAEDRITDGLNGTNDDSVIARRRELREQALTREYLIVSRDVPAFTPVTD